MKAPRNTNQKTQNKSPKKRLLLDPPLKLPEEVEKLYATSDFVELEYRTIEKLRGIKKRTPEQNQRLAEHDAIEQRIEDDPVAVLREAHEAIDHGTDLLLKLIRSRKLEQSGYYADGSICDEWDNAFLCLQSRLEYFNSQLVRLAGSGVPRARRTVFFQAKALTEAFIRLAQAYPGDFVNSAEFCLTMPSLRSRNPKFTADAKAIAKTIHLAEKHPAGMMTDDKERIGELCGYLVATILDSIVSERKYYQWEAEALERLQDYRESADEYRGISVEEFVRSHYYPPKSDQMMVSVALPEFSDDPKAWWKQGVLPRLREDFERLKKDPSRNAALWTELCRATNNGTDGAKWKALSDNCRNKVNQFARRAGAERFV